MRDGVGVDCADMRALEERRGAVWGGVGAVRLAGVFAWLALVLGVGEDPASLEVAAKQTTFMSIYIRTITQHTKAYVAEERFDWLE